MLFIFGSIHCLPLKTKDDDASIDAAGPAPLRRSPSAPPLKVGKGGRVYDDDDDDDADDDDAFLFFSITSCVTTDLMHAIVIGSENVTKCI